MISRNNWIYREEKREIISVKKVHCNQQNHRYYENVLFDIFSVIFVKHLFSRNEIHFEGLIFQNKIFFAPRGPVGQNRDTPNSNHGVLLWIELEHWGYFMLLLCYLNWAGQQMACTRSNLKSFSEGQFWCFFIMLHSSKTSGFKKWHKKSYNRSS